MATHDNDGQKTGRCVRGFAALLIFMHVGGYSATGIEASEKPDGWVARAVFTSAIEQREPVDQLAVVSNSMRQVYFFTDLRQLEGRRITHRWEYDGEVMAEVTFKVGGPRWRVFSSKSLDPDKTGKWTVVVVDESGWPLRASIFDYRLESAIDREGGYVELPIPVDELQQTAPPERGPASSSVQ